MDLPVWQALYNEIGDRGFVPIAVAFETRGAEAARPWIEAAKASYPALIDQWHVVADLYGMLNVPIAVWINEEGRIVRPPESAGTADAFRQMDRVNFTVPPDAARDLREARTAYLDALRDWVANGDRSRFALAPEEVRRRLEPVTTDSALAAAEFRLGEYLHTIGREAAAQAHFAEAKRLAPDSWAYKRQAWNLEHPLTAGGPEFWAAVDALGDAPYYKPVPDIGASPNP